MTDSPDNSNRWMDGEIRRVPLPDGLLARLRRLAENGADDELDEQICSVALPEGLLGRLAAIVDDEPLDRRMSEVPLPDGLMARLYQIPDDELLDHAIRDVAVPASLAPAAVVPATVAAVRRETVRTALRQWSVAAAVAIAVGAGYFSGLDRLSTWFAGETNSVAGSDGEAPSEDLIDDPFRSDRELAAFGEFDAGLSADELLSTADLMAEFAGGSDVAADQLIAEIDRQLGRPAALDIAASWPTDDAGTGPVLGVVPHALDLPPLEAPLPLAPHGVAPPTTPGYDRTALARFGVHPFVNPSAHPLLESALAPLVHSTASYDAMRWRLREEAARKAAGRANESLNVLSAANVRVRTEEFLAAMRYDFPPPDSGVAIRTAAGPSPFTTSNVRLLQVGVQAAALASASREPVELTVAVDVSPRMGHGGRLEIVRQSLVDLIERLRPEDRVSIVAFGTNIRVLVDRSAPNNPLLRPAIGRLAPEQGTNFHAGVERAVETASVSADRKRRQIVVFADAPTFVTQAQRSATRRVLAAAAGNKIGISIVDLSQGAIADDDLESLAAAAQCKLQRASSMADARRCLDQALFDRSTVVAEKVELSLRFNPRAVAAYRLVGHEATLGLPTAPLAVSLRSAEAATALFEIVLRDDGVNDVGTVELEWVDPVSGKKQLLTQPISRVQFANSLAESALSLQAAAVAAEAAEILRGAKVATVSPEHSLDRTLEVARAVHPRLREQAEFRGLVELIELARQAGLGRSTP